MLHFAHPSGCCTPRGVSFVWCCVCFADKLPPYALEYRARWGVLPWELEGLLPWEPEGIHSSTAPWLSLLPPEAKGSLYEWGGYLFSQTPACKRGSISVDRYGEWVQDLLFASKRTSAADMLAVVCAAFAYSPLSIVIEMRAVMQCISLATKRLLAGDRSNFGAPSSVERQLDHVCAAGCGKDLSKGHTHIPQYGDTLKYCSDECAQKVSVPHRTAFAR